MILQEIRINLVGGTGDYILVDGFMGNVPVLNIGIGWFTEPAVISDFGAAVPGAEIDTVIIWTQNLMQAGHSVEFVGTEESVKVTLGAGSGEYKVSLVTGAVAGPGEEAINRSLLWMMAGIAVVGAFILTRKR